MGDTAKDKRQEQLKRWSGSSTDREPAVPRRRWRGDVEDAGCSEAVNNAVSKDHSQDVEGSGSTTGEANSLLLKRRRRVRFDTAAEFLAACASGDTDEAQEMLKDAKESEGKNGDYQGKVVNCANADGITALHQACIDGSMEVMVFLLAQGANINQVDSEGWTPLHVAATCGNLEITDFLLQQGASLTAVNCDGDVPLDIAEDEATESLLHQYTVRQGVDVEAAKRVEEEQIMKDARAWLTEGPPSELRHPKTGATPLHVAAAKGYLEAIKLLCQCGLDVSEMDCDGWTPLHAASHWGQGDACRILAEQLCDMEVCSNGGQTPFDVADESVVSLLEELSQKQANWRNEQSIMDRQNPAGSTAAKADSKRRRTSVCRMSSKEKMNVQDQSKERRSEGLELSEEKESSPESSTLSSPDTESATSTVSPAEKQVPEEKDVEERDQDRASRTARVQPTPQRKDPLADSPNNTNPDRRKFQAPVRDEESESQRKARSRLMRQSRRSTQGVTLTDLKEAEKSVAKPADSPPSNILHVSPIVTITPTERDTDTVKEVGSEGETRLGVRDRRKGRRERRSTGVVQLGNEHLDAMDEAQQDENHRHSSPSEPQLGDSSPDYKMLYRSVLQENGLLKDELQETALLLSQSKVELERLRQSQESSTERPALLELERFEKRALQRKAVELEDELKVLVDLRADNQRLKDENAALIRVISKLSK
ncbi:protein phosphatase 1 regulatory subunit 12C-like isoform X1 [Salvelinus fontinalis]|uniref:protein phosphatase 1 regulatory subunit 12C-like isoform X1 n=1 Tax=Salvelinus fontinalis TaxID=8038 RepID=UPI00248533AB|nr:protein phosphatase 1 regulatory subunit 12C-like isoform X1 [Salvelinus fontinalis]